MSDVPGHVYWREIASAERSSLSVLCSFIAPGSRVLDLGIGSGALARELRRLQCTVDGVTVNPQEASIAREWYARIDVLDLDRPGWDSGFAQGSYDAIVCADVLEHLVHPEAVLAACRSLLRSDGALLVSVPNVAYAGLIAALMHGNFEYGNEGLMDRTHLRFFTRGSFQRLLAAQGWLVQRVESIEQPLHETEYTLAFDALPPAVGRYLLAQPDAHAYQLVFVARASAQPPLQAPPPRAVPVSAATFVAQLFVASGDGFAAERKIIRLGTIGLERQTLRFEIPAALSPWGALRFDPADRPGFFWLHAIRLLDAGSRRIWEWTASASSVAQLEGCVRHQLDVGEYDAGRARLPLLLGGDDPSIELPIPAHTVASCDREQCTLEVECGWPMSADYLAAARRFSQLELTSRMQQEKIDALRAAVGRDEVRAPQQMQPVATANPAPPAPRAWRGLRSFFGAKPAPALDAGGPAQDPTVEILVPVYGSLPLVQRCLRSLQRTTGSALWHLTVIDDASPDPAMRDWLHAFALANPDATVIENARNLGFVRTVNLGLRLAGRRDVVLLNSDTEVANDWLDRLRAASLSHERVGTVTPFSNNATICSYPQYCADNPLPPGEDTASLDRVVSKVNAGHAVDIPTAVGFCMYIRRACLDQVGELDAASFGHGYGEENDFCLRASALGWRHLHALDVFVYHEGGASFKETRHALQARALETIRRLHPGYEELIRQFVQRDPARPFREAIDRARSAAASAPQL